MTDPGKHCITKDFLTQSVMFTIGSAVLKFIHIKYVEISSLPFIRKASSDLERLRVTQVEGNVKTVVNHQRK